MVIPLHNFDYSLGPLIVIVDLIESSWSVSVLIGLNQMINWLDMIYVGHHRYKIDLIEI